MKKYFSYDNEYISGNTYFLRFMLNFFLAILLIGFYLLSVNAYKRSKSLGHSESVSVIWAIWGFLVPFLGLLPIAIITNTIPHFYLWFSNGKNKSSKPEVIFNKIKSESDFIYKETDNNNESFVPKSLSKDIDDLKENN